MARRGGLGPQGRHAVQRAAAEASRAPKRTQIRQDPSTTQAGNPAVTSTVETEKDIADRVDNWWTPAKSTRVAQAAYDPQSRKCLVLFHKPYPGGTSWTYDNVTPAEWASFQSAPSAGKYINAVLNGHNYHPGAWG